MFIHKNVFTLLVSVTGSYTEGEPNFPRQNNLVLSKKLSGVDKVVNFRDFSRKIKKSSTFQGRNKQLLVEVEHDMMNYQNRGLCYLPKQKAEADNTDTRF